MQPPRFDANDANPFLDAEPEPLPPIATELGLSLVDLALVPLPDGKQYRGHDDDVKVGDRVTVSGYQGAGASSA